MKIYVCHSSAFDYKKELYEPIRNSFLNKKHEFIFPHEKSDEIFNSKDVISTCDLIIAEVSYPSTGQGIELGWANKDKKRTTFLYKKGSKISISLSKISNEFVEYTDAKNLIIKLNLLLN